VEPRLPLVGMAKESERLCQAFRDHTPILLLGLPGSGKTRLIQEAISENEKILYVAWERSLHALLTKMAGLLIAARHPDFLRLAGVSPVRRFDPKVWLRAQTSVHLKGLLWSAFEISPVSMVLDGIAGAGFPTYRFLQRIYHAPGMALFASSRDTFSLGALARLFWDPTKMLSLAPLHDLEAGQLFDAAATYFELRNLDLEEFREKVLESARGNPGQIIEMCRLATQPQYISGRYIKFAPLRIDAIIKFAG